MIFYLKYSQSIKKDIFKVYDNYVQIFYQYNKNVNTKIFGFQNTI